MVARLVVTRRKGGVEVEVVLSIDGLGPVDVGTAVIEGVPGQVEVTKTTLFGEEIVTPSPFSPLPTPVTSSIGS